MDASKARILFVTTSSGVGGSEKNLALLARAERPRWSTLGVCSLKPPGRYGRDLEREGIPLFACGLPEGRGARGAVATLAAAFRLLGVVRAFRPTLVHAFLFRAGLAARLPALLGRVPRLVVSVRRLESRGAGIHLLDRWSSGVVHAFTAVSEAARQQIARRSGIPPGRIRRIPNGVAVDGPEGGPSALVDWRRVRREEARRRLAALLGENPPELLIGSAGRLEPVKGHRILLEAFARVLPRRSDPGVGPPSSRLGLVLAGEGGERARLDEWAAQSPLRGRVFLLGERVDLPDLLPAFDLFVLPSLSEGMSNALLEAMAEGIPVIATRTGGNPEVVEGSVSGLLVDPGEPAALAGAIGSLAFAPERAASLGWAGRERVRREFSLEAMLGAYRRLYAELLEPL